MTPSSRHSGKTILMIRNAYQHDFGGGERFPVDNGGVLASLGYDVVIVSRSAKLLEYAKSKKLTTIRGLWWSNQNWGGWRIALLPVFLLWQIVLFYWYLNLYIRTAADVVHLQSRDDFIAGTLAARLLGKRVIWTDHADLKYIYANHTLWYKNPIGKIVYTCSKLAHAVTLVSKSEKSLVQESLGKKVPNNYTVIYNGVISEPIQTIPRPPAAKNDVVFASSSRLVKAKGVGELIDAFTQIQIAHPKSRLYLFGEGPEEETFKSQAQGNERIEFRGFPVNSLAQIAGCDIFVHPSYHEGFSISLVEATKLGLPIIACDVGGNGEIITDKDNGLLVPAKNSEALASAMSLLAKDRRLREALGKTSRQVYEKSFKLEEIIADRFIPLYEGSNEK